ncbi:hypothetical protein FDP41_008036 [Naegleria fowleri]|uniref:Uncharacterized protein n=1 Tax=Naegleria fowleri TaxID=5763 RepID=A0A6A5CA75_NAEFO|nr:uncharacterized protein FDP41_008036 [Naegleria fowleri]KAF0984121.1 hypothetical protein FDP41_008036 [Naegleria fowleri]CAG4717115.1 unnamed protein product [Naegleria fowleri]
MHKLFRREVASIQSSLKLCFGIKNSRFSFLLLSKSLFTQNLSTRKLYHHNIIHGAHIQHDKNNQCHEDDHDSNSLMTMKDLELIFKTKSLHQDHSNQALFQFINHVLYQSNGEAFLYIFKSKHTRPYEEEIILSNDLQIPITLLRNIQNKAVVRMNSEQELLNVLSDLALYGGAYAERPENSLAESWAIETIQSWKSIIHHKQSHKNNMPPSFDVNNIDIINTENLLEFSSGICINLYELDSAKADACWSSGTTVSHSKITIEDNSSLISRINKNPPFAEFKYFFNGSIWDKILLCNFKWSASEKNMEYYYVLVGITDKE